jgi:hypothetical protein
VGPGIVSPSGPTAAPAIAASAPVTGPIAATGPNAVRPATDGAPPGLATAFDLSLAIPQPDAASASSDPALAAPPAVESAPRPATVAFLGAPPAGPSPLHTPDAPAHAEPVSFVPTAPGSRTGAAQWSLPFSRRQLAIGGGSVLGLVVLIAIIATVAGGSATPRVAAVADAAVVAPPPRPPSPAQDQLTRAEALVTDGRPDSALELLLSARRVFPDDAQLPVAAGKLYFAKFWFTAGLRQFRDALQLDPSYRSDPEVIRTALKGFITDRSYNSEIARFLREDIGAPAKSFLEETASTHPNRTIRDRAATELRRYR